MSEDCEPPGGTRKDSHPEPAPKATVVALFGDGAAPPDASEADTLGADTLGAQPPMSDAEFMDRLRGADAVHDSRPLGLSERPLSAAVMAAMLLPHPFERIVRFRHQAQRQGMAIDVAFWEEALRQLILITSPKDCAED